MYIWSPWRGCRRVSEGCRFCYIHKGDAKRGVDTGSIIKNDDTFYAPVAVKKDGAYKMRAGSTVYVCFSSDFLIEEADRWRRECWEIIKERNDLNFLFLTKRIERFADNVPSDWDDGYDNVTVGCTVEDQGAADRRLAVFDDLPIKHKNIIASPMIGPIDLEGHLKDVELVVVGGEQDKDARPLDYDWVLRIRDQCVISNVRFQFRQCGTHFIIDGNVTKVPPYQQGAVARKMAVDL
ncbi:MAG: phage Gp37/Gp68 family protein [Methanomassiliicoccaceae archaeon]|jgi:protein gp37|nr:phage Gp37/Gp68 family protein [Methanomassiliicoccaceae archaeon]